jgi:hypothetical protein
MAPPLRYPSTVGIHTGSQRLGANADEDSAAPPHKSAHMWDETPLKEELTWGKPRSAMVAGGPRRPALVPLTVATPPRR